MLTDTLRVGLIGNGSIGATVARALSSGVVAGCSLAGVLTRAPRSTDHAVASIHDLIACSDFIVEAAGPMAVKCYGPSVRRAGLDLLVVSVGALVDDELFADLRQPVGRLLISSGAIGGLDALRAAQSLGAFDDVSLTTTKPLRALAMPPHGNDLTSERVGGVVFSGFAREAVLKFPHSLNVAATLSLVTVGFDRTRVTLVADPHLQQVEHAIHASGPAGLYDFRFRNRPSVENTATSAVTPHAVIRLLQDLRSPLLVGV